VKSSPEREHVRHQPAPQQGSAKIETDELFENDPVRDAKLPRRRLARERVLQLLYARELTGRDFDQIFSELIEASVEDERTLEFARTLTLIISTHMSETNQLMTEHLKHWDFNRVALIDRLLIQMGIAELCYFPEIPPKATINELIEISKDYSTEESGKFINGILHAVMTVLQERGDINKTGRGLIDKKP
jgi:transcription antitermination protein NusB